MEYWLILLVIYASLKAVNTETNIVLVTIQPEHLNAEDRSETIPYEQSTH